MIVIHRVRVGPYPAPGRASVRLGRVTTHTMRKALYDGKRQLTGLVDPAAGQLEREQLADILRLVERQKNNLAIKPWHNRRAAAA